MLLCRGAPHSSEHLPNQGKERVLPNANVTLAHSLPRRIPFVEAELKWRFHRPPSGIPETLLSNISSTIWFFGSMRNPFVSIQSGFSGSRTRFGPWILNPAILPPIHGPLRLPSGWSIISGVIRLHDRRSIVHGLVPWLTPSIHPRDSHLVWRWIDRRFRQALASG